MARTESKIMAAKKPKKSKAKKAAPKKRASKVVAKPAKRRPAKSQVERATMWGFRNSMYIPLPHQEPK